MLHISLPICVLSIIIHLASFLRYYYVTFRVYMTVCHHEKSFSFDMTVEITGCVQFPIHM